MGPAQDVEDVVGVKALATSRGHGQQITVSKNEAPARLASFLLWTDHAYAPPGRIAGEMTLPMARHDIADYIGLSVESVSRALLVLEAQGLSA